jgi:hypothetical protein
MHFRPVFWIHAAISFYIVYDFYRTTWRTLWITGFVAKKSAQGMAAVFHFAGIAGSAVVEKIGGENAVAKISESAASITDSLPVLPTWESLPNSESAWGLWGKVTESAKGWTKWAKGGR